LTSDHPGDDATVVLRPDGGSPFVLVCEHASNFMPARYHALGLADPDCSRHIAWDIGAAHLTRLLSKRLDATAILAGFSRLLIDANRPPHVPSSIPSLSEDTPIPGNIDLSEAERDLRLRHFFQPFHGSISCQLDRRQRGSRPTAIVGVHSFTPVFLGEARPYHVGVLFDATGDWATALRRHLRERTGLDVRLNQPYAVTPEEDYTAYVHGAERGFAALLIEVRNDLLDRPQDISQLARQMGDALEATAAFAQPNS
jgi:predicted N-formylglutamate amidohydrolase